MARKQKALVDGKWVTFVNDADGLSAKDYLLIISTGVFFVALAVGFVMLAFGLELSSEWFGLLEAASPVVITVVAGVMGTQAVQTWADRRQPDATLTEEEKPYE